MNKEEIEQIKDILKNIENWIESPIDDIDKNYGIWEFNYKEANLLLKYIVNLQHQLEEKDKVIDEVKEYIIKNTNYDNCNSKNILDLTDRDNLLEILERGKNGNS